MATRRTARKRKMTPEDLHRITFVGDPRIRPDGGEVLFVHKRIGEKNRYETNLWLVPSSGGDARPFTTGGRDGQGRWSADGTRVAFVRGHENAGPQVYLIGADGGEARQLTSFPEGTIGKIAWSPDAKHLAVAFRETDPDWTREKVEERKKNGLMDPPRVLDDPWYRLDGDGYFNGQRFKLYVVDVKTGEHRLLYGKDTLGMFDFDWAPDSRRLAVATNRDRKAFKRDWKDEILIVDARTGKFRAVNLPEGCKTHVRWSPDGTRLAYAGREGETGLYDTRNLELWVCDPVKGNAKCLTGKEDYCLMAVALTDTAEAAFGPNFQWAGSRRLLVSIGWHGETHLASIGVGGGKLQFLTEGRYDQVMGSVSHDGRRVALIRATVDKLGEVYVGQLGPQGLAVKQVTHLNRDFLAELQLASFESHWVKAEDGHRSQVFVLRPPGVSRKTKVPGVLTIHGGPHAMYGVGFFHEFQCMAAAGYAVFFPNPRGSKGYGEKHCAAIHGHWGDRDWADVVAVKEFMKSRPWVNAKRMGVMGGSYGGYMTNWAIGHTNDFAGAITDRCVANLVSMAGSSDFAQVPDKYWKGNFWDKPEALWRDSPIQYMGKVKTPTLIIHSEGDLRCNIEQAEQVYSLLTLRDVPTRFVRYPRSTSHGMSRGGPPDMRNHRLHQILDWWKKYLKK